MKLRNKKTGEIIDIYKGEITLHYDQGRKTIHFKRLDDLEEWEDYEEPKEYWYIENNGDIDKETYDGDEYEEKMIEIGNYFETKEEAEKAVEKLKAWKRLKDKGFRFGGWERDKRFWGDYTIEAQDYTTCDDKDLDLLFGGEE